MKSPRCLEVFIAGSHAGELRMSNGGALSFAYDRSYAGPDLSACMPFSSEEYLLAPLYDLASAAPYMEKGKTYRLAMSIGGENRVGWLRKSNLARFAKLHGLQTADLSLRVDELSELIKGNLEEALNGFAGCSGIDELACRLIPRIRVLCDAAQKNIRVDAAQFEPVDISRLR